MGTVAVLQKLDDESLISILQEVGANLNGGVAELLLDFTAVRRLDAGALRAIEAFVTRAETESVKVVLRSVSVDVYKVLALVKLTSRFLFVS